MIIDNEFKSLIPSLTIEEYKQLEKSIIDEGCRDALVTWQDTLIDGHNRYEICNKHGIKFKTIANEFDTREDVMLWMINNQLGKRNLPEYVKYELMEKKTEILKDKGKKTQGKRTDLLSTIDKKLNIQEPLSTIDKPSHNTQKIIANELGWSTGKKAQADVVHKKAPEEVKEKLRANEITINKAYQQVKQIEEGTKICTICGIEKPISEFYKGKGKCKECYSIGKEKVAKDFMGNVYKSSREADQLAKEHMEDIARDMYDNNKVIIITSDDLVMDLQSFTDAFIRNVNRSVDEYDITMTQENSKKITAILLTVEQAVEKIKGCFINE